MTTAYNIGGEIVTDTPEFDDIELGDIELDDLPSKRDLSEWREWANELTISQLINSQLPF